jgi:MFS family permease
MHNEARISQHTIRNMLSRDFVVGFLALFVFLSAYFVLIPTLPIYFSGLGSTETEIGVLIGIFGASSLVFRLGVGGALARYSEKRVMMGGAALFALTFLASLVLRPFWPFFMVRFFQGVAFACFDTAVLAFIIKVTPLAYRGQGLGYFALAPSLSAAVSPSFGMFLINEFSFTVLFLVSTGLSLCACLLSSKLKGERVAQLGKGTRNHGSVFFERKIVAPAITNFLKNFAWGAIVAFLPLYAIQCGVSNPGHFFSASAVMIIAARALGGRILDIYRKEKIMRTVIFTSMVAMIMLAFAKTLPMFILVGALWGVGSAFFFPASMAHALEYAGSSSGTAVGTFRAIGDLGIALGPMIMGIVLPFAGYRIMFLCLALVCFINLTYLQFYMRKRNVAPTG